jgi:chromosome segregation ATPase
MADPTDEKALTFEDSDGDTMTLTIERFHKGDRYYRGWATLADLAKAIEARGLRIFPATNREAMAWTDRQEARIVELRHQLREAEERAGRAEGELARVREELEAVAPTRHTVSDYDGGDGERTRTCAHLGAWQNERRLRVEAEHQRDELSDHLDRQRIEHDETRGYRHQAELDRDAARSKLAEVERELRVARIASDGSADNTKRLYGENASLRSQLNSYRTVVEAARPFLKAWKDGRYGMGVSAHDWSVFAMALNDATLNALPAPSESEPSR